MASYDQSIRCKFCGSLPAIRLSAEGHLLIHCQLCDKWKGLCTICLEVVDNIDIDTGFCIFCRTDFDKQEQFQEKKRLHYPDM